MKSTKVLVRADFLFQIRNHASQPASQQANKLKRQHKLFNFSIGSKLEIAKFCARLSIGTTWQDKQKYHSSLWFE
jgi:hypothetical protein